ncbi:MAG: hypothetical protein KY476_19845, partial [Planctomycetes bacterium]|nr:hypothetical protein [Planctomycetota bacterium]
GRCCSRPDAPLRESSPLRCVRLVPVAPLRLVCLALVLLTSGCREEASIRAFTVPKQELIDPPPQVEADQTPATPLVPTRMLAAIVPGDEDKVWFFKLMGPDQAVAAREPQFREFLESVRLEGGEPRWTLPEGWRALPGSSLRFATLVVGSDDAGRPLELTVIPLGQSGNRDEYLLANVNRWRDQLGLEDISAAELERELETVELGSGTAYTVNLAGRAAGPPSMGRSPLLPADHPPVGPGGLTAEPRK